MKEVPPCPACGSSDQKYLLNDERDTVTARCEACGHTHTFEAKGYGDAAR